MSNSFYDDKEKDKYTHTNNIIHYYNDLEILPSKFFLPFTLALTSYYLIQKLSDNFMARWQVCFYPVLFYIIFNFFSSFFKILKSEMGFDDDEKYKSNINVENIDKITLLSNFFKMILCGFSFFSIYYFALFMDFNKDQDLIFSLKMSIGFSFSYIIYYFLKFSSILSIRKPNISNQNSEDFNETNSWVSFYSSLTAPILTYFSNMMVVCSGGACQSIVASTIGSLLGAFGVTVSNFSAYLFPITVIMLLISLYSLYARRKNFMHKPFLLGVFSCTLIIISHFNEENNIYYLIYPGNILMIAAAIWNYKINKLYGLPRYSK